MQKEELAFLINILVNKYAGKKNRLRATRNERLLFEEIVRNKPYHLAKLHEQPASQADKRCLAHEVFTSCHHWEEVESLPSL